MSARLHGWLPFLFPRQGLGSTVPLCQHLDFTCGVLSLLLPPNSGWECQCTTLLGAALLVAVTVTSWGTTAWCVELGENALRATMLCVMPSTTLQLLLGSPHRRRAALFCLEMIGGQLTSSSLAGQGAEMPHWM